MEKERENRKEDERFGEWKNHHKMTGEEAFHAMFGEKGKEYPEEMKEEFIQLYDGMREAFKNVHDNRKVFIGKWKDVIGEENGPFAAERKYHGFHHHHMHMMHAFGNRGFHDSDHPHFSEDK